MWDLDLGQGGDRTTQLKASVVCKDLKTQE